MRETRNTSHNSLVKSAGSSFASSLWDMLRTQAVVCPSGYRKASSGPFMLRYVCLVCVAMSISVLTWFKDNSGYHVL